MLQGHWFGYRLDPFHLEIHHAKFQLNLLRNGWDIWCLEFLGGGCWVMGVWQGRSSRNSRYTEKLDRLPIWLSNTCHGTSTLQICKLMDRSTCLPISEAHRMFWNTLERTAFPELNLKLIVYMLFNNIFFQIHILLQISCHFLFMLHALAGIYTLWRSKHQYEKLSKLKKDLIQS